MIIFLREKSLGALPLQIFSHEYCYYLSRLSMNNLVLSPDGPQNIVVHDSTFFRGTLEVMLSEGLQNCPMAGGTRAVLEARGRHHFHSPKEKGGVITLFTGFDGFPII